MRMRKSSRQENRTNLGKTQIEKASCQDDHFRRLPEELLIYILTIVADLNSLCRCSLVSKHFASVVPRVRTVCVIIPSSGPHSKEYLKTKRKPPKPKPLVFLEKFRELESIHLEYKYPENSANSSFSKWKVNFSTNFPNIEKFVALISPSVNKQTANEPYHEHASQPNNTGSDLAEFAECFWLSFACCVKWMCVISMLGRSHTSLKGVTVADSEKQGKLVIGDEQLDRLRSVREPRERWFLRPQLYAMANIPELHLPLSGYVMRRALTLIITFPTESCTSAIDKGVSWDFEDEEKVLGEAMIEIFKNHRDKIKIRNCLERTSNPIL